MLKFVINLLDKVLILPLVGVILFFTPPVFAAQLDKVCAKEILILMDKKKNLIKDLDSTKSYIKTNTWISDSKQMDVNGHWAYIDEIVEQLDKLILSLPIINDPAICMEQVQVSVDLINYISESNKLIFNEILKVVKEAPNIVTSSKCDSQFLCDSYFFYYFQKALADYSFYRFGIFNEKLENFKLKASTLPPVNLRKKELILY